MTPLGDLRTVPLKRRLLWGAAAGLALGGLTAALLGPLESFENRALDGLTRFLAPARPAADRIAIVLIDEGSIAAMKESTGDATLGWPWPREFQAAIARFLHLAGARAVLFDVVFADDSRLGVSDDRTFAEAIRGAGPVHLAAKLEPVGADPAGGALERSAVRAAGWRFPARQGLDRVVGPNPVLEPAAAGLGVINVVQDRDNTIRRADLLFPLVGRLVPSLGLAGALAALGGARGGAVEGRWLRIGGLRIPLEPDGRVLLRWYAPGSAFPTYQASDLVQSWGNLEDGDEAIGPRVDPARFRDCVVFVGANVSGNEDVITAPTSTRLRGVELHATLCANILGEEFLRRPAEAIRAAARALGGLLAGLATFAAWRPLRAGLAAVALAVLQALLALTAFRSGLALDLLVPEVVIAAAFSASAVAGYFGEGRQKQEVARAFGQYLSPAVIRDLMRRPEGLRLGGERREITVFFSDLEGFSAFSERMQPEELVAFLNLYLGAMTDVIQARRGVVDKYQGDSVMAFWGAPEPLAGDAAEACLAAIEQRQALDALNERFRAEGRPLLRMRAGLHRGPAVVGNMGSAQRFAYTAMGDTVNLASRLEGANKFFGTSILLSEAARAAAGETVVARGLGRIRVVGKSVPTAVYELRGRRGEVPEAELRRLRLHEEALGRLERGDGAGAARLLEEVLAAGPDPPAERLLAFARERLGSGGAAWDGVFELTSK